MRSQDKTVEAMRDDQRGAVARQLFQSGLHQRLAFGIERGGGFVEQQERRIAQDGRHSRAMTLWVGSTIGAAQQH